MIPTQLPGYADSRMATVAATAFEDALQDVRERTLALVAPFSHAELERVQHPLMSPLDWDLGHIAAYEDLWLVHRHGGEPLLRGDLADLYDAFETPRAARGDIPFLRGDDVFDYLAAVRERTLAVLDRVGPGDGTLFEMVVRHEAQHNETMRQTLFLGGLPGGRPRAGAAARPPPRRRSATGSRSPPAPSRWAPPPSGFAFDNERPRHERRRARLRDRPPARDERDVDALRRGRRLRAARVVVGRGLGVEGGVRHHAPRGLDGGRGGRRRRPARPARLLVRGRCLGSFARCAIAHRGGMGKGSDLGPGSAAGHRLASGSGRPRRFGGYPGFVAHPYREYSEVFFGDALPRPARRVVGDRGARALAPPFATGISPCAGRSSPASDSQRT